MTDIDHAGRLLDEAREYVQSRCQMRPETAIILGSGLGALADSIDRVAEIAFSEIPGWHSPSASGHAGRLVFGVLESRQVVAMAGRYHRYEGWSNHQVAFPVTVMSALGARRLIVSNAAGGLSPKLRVGDIVVIRDHINWIGFQLPGRAGQPFLHRSGAVYDPDMCQIALRAAIDQGCNAIPGTYLATLGPNYETRSEVRMMRRMGADVVGMSTVPEVLAANDVKMRVLGLSVVTNIANPDRAVVADHADVLHAGRAAEVNMEAIVRRVVTAA